MRRASAVSPVQLRPAEFISRAKPRQRQLQTGGDLFARNGARAPADWKTDAMRAECNQEMDKPLPIQKGPNKEIMEHNAKRQVEIKIMQVGDQRSLVV